jgi:GNAT superfamily N-acetyltransferase
MLRTYNDQDKDAVISFHERILRETGAFLPGRRDEDLENVGEVYLRPGGCFVLVEENGVIQAMGALRIVSETVAEIKRMRVDTTLQRQGLGQFVLDHLLQHAKTRGVERVILDTSDRQKPARRFYEKNGFTEYKRSKWNELTIIFYEKLISR